MPEVSSRVPLRLRRTARRVAGTLIALALSLPLGSHATRAASPELEDDSVSLWLAGMTFVASRGARTEVLLEAEHTRLHPDQKLADLENVRAVVMGDDGRASLRLSCQKGEFDLDTQDFVARDGVRGRTADGRRFASAWIRYDHARGLAYTDAPVLIEEGDRTLRGGGLRYHVKQGKLRLLGGASVVQAP